MKFRKGDKVKFLKMKDNEVIDFSAEINRSLIVHGNTEVDDRYYKES